MNQEKLTKPKFIDRRIKFKDFTTKSTINLEYIESAGNWRRTHEFVSQSSKLLDRSSREIEGNV